MVGVTKSKVAFLTKNFNVQGQLDSFVFRLLEDLYKVKEDEIRPILLDTFYFYFLIFSENVRCNQNKRKMELHGYCRGIYSTTKDVDTLLVKVFGKQEDLAEKENLSKEENLTLSLAKLLLSKLQLPEMENKEKVLKVLEFLLIQKVKVFFRPVKKVPLKIGNFPANSWQSKLYHSLPYFLSSSPEFSFSKYL